MKKTIINLLIFISAGLIINSCSPSEPQQIAQHVIVIGIDGLSPDGVLNSKTPIMDKMMAQGSSSMHARAVMPSSSGANWGSMIMGAGPEQHGIISNDWKTDSFELHPTVFRNKNLFPTVFAVIRDQRPDSQIGAILDWNPISNFIEEDVTDYTGLPENEDETTQEAIDYILNQSPNFLFIHIDHVDGAGHSQGHGTEPYYEAVAKADSLIGEIVKATEEAGMSDETVFIISSDHGGVGFGHGGNTPAEIEIPFIVYGKGVKQGHELNFPINTYDNPATVLFALGLDIPFEWIGRPVKAAFEGNSDPVLMYSLNNLAPAPIISPVGEGGSNPAGGLFINETPELDIKSHDADGIIRFTIDGSEPNEDAPVFEESIPITENTVVKAAVFRNNAMTSQIATGYFRIADESSGNGVLYSLFEIAEETTMLPNFSSLSPTATGVVPEISTNDLPLPRESYIAAVLEGDVEIPADGTYTFYLASDDGSKLYIGNELVVDNDGDHGVITKSGLIELTEGHHPIRAEWFNGGGGFWLGAYVEGPDLPKQIIPPSMLKANGM